MEVISDSDSDDAVSINQQEIEVASDFTESDNEDEQEENKAEEQVENEEQKEE